MVGEFRIDDFAAQRLEAAQRAFLVDFDQARIAGDIGRQDRREPTFDASWPCGLHGASSIANDPTRTGARRALSMRAGVTRSLSAVAASAVGLFTLRRRGLNLCRDHIIFLKLENALSSSKRS